MNPLYPKGPTWFVRNVRRNLDESLHQTHGSREHETLLKVVVAKSVKIKPLLETNPDLALTHPNLKSVASVGRMCIKWGPITVRPVHTRRQYVQCVAKSFLKPRIISNLLLKYLNCQCINTRNIVL